MTQGYSTKRSVMRRKPEFVFASPRPQRIVLKRTPPRWLVGLLLVSATYALAALLSACSTSVPVIVDRPKPPPPPPELLKAPIGPKPLSATFSSEVLRTTQTIFAVLGR